MEPKTDKKTGRYVPKYAPIEIAVELLYEAQKGLCPICNEPLGSIDKAAWDHDHKTGEGRDLVHKGCNVFLGFIERDPSIINRVLEYCKRYKINAE